MLRSPRRLAPLFAVAAVAVLLFAAVVGMVAGAQNSSGASSGVASSTIPAVTCGQATVYLGAAGNFRILAGTTITNTGSTTVKGNIGVSPGSAITGFPPGKVTGAIHSADTAAANAQLALKTAYNTAAGRTNCPVAVAGNIGGQTLGPGLYKSVASLSISSGDLTLTAHGHPNAVFIFQMTSKLTVTSGRHVILAGGALASHIYWVVGSSATLGTTSVVYGNILAHKSISLATGAVLHGRALANIGAVTLAGDSLAQAPYATSGVPTTSRSLSAAMVVP